EGFNSYRELSSHAGRAPATILKTMAWLVPIGPVAGLLGYFLLSDQPLLMGAILLFASGGILYLLFQDIAPQSRIDKHWAPALGAVFGFCLALWGDLLVAHP
ncbi:MAG: ZIP family metal transporter, partial [Algiphilus sp.]